METKSEQPQPQLLRFNEEEIEILENVFKDNYNLLRILRNHILQIPLTAVDLSVLTISIKNKPNVLKVLRKKLLPVIEADNPVGTDTDIWLSLPIRELPFEIVELQIEATQIWIDYLDQQLKLLEGKKIEDEIKLKDLENIYEKTPRERHVDMLARNFIISGTKQILTSFLYERKPETQKEKELRHEKDSAK